MIVILQLICVDFAIGLLLQWCIIKNWHNDSAGHGIVVQAEMGSFGWTGRVDHLSYKRIGTSDIQWTSQGRQISWSQCRITGRWQQCQGRARQNWRYHSLTSFTSLLLSFLYCKLMISDNRGQLTTMHRALYSSVLHDWHCFCVACPFLSIEVKDLRYLEIYASKALLI